MKKKVLNVGIMSWEDYKARTLALVKGEASQEVGEPKVWFESLKSVAQILSPENQRLLKTIIEKQPESLQEVASLTGRKLSNISRTLHTMERYEIVQLTKSQRKVKPTVLVTDFKVEFGLIPGSSSLLHAS